MNRKKTTRMSRQDNIPARNVFWALHHLHMAGSELSDRQHEYIDRIEPELCAIVRSTPEPCVECERPTPSVLLREEGAEGRCPRCRGEAPPSPVVTGPAPTADPSASDMDRNEQEKSDERMDSIHGSLEPR